MSKGILQPVAFKLRDSESPIGGQKFRTCEESKLACKDNNYRTYLAT